MFHTCCKLVASKLKREPRNVVKFRKYSAAILKSKFGEVEVPEQTLTEFVWSNQTPEWKNLPALTCGLSGRSYTYGDIKTLVRQGAMALVKRTNLKPGDRVALLLSNTPEYFLAVHSSLLAGFTVTFANPIYTVDELTRQFRSAEVKCIIVEPCLLENAKKVAETLQNYDCTICIGGKSNPGQKVLGLDEMLSEDHSDAKLPRVNPSDLAILPYSSGTTGLPKGVMLNHKNLAVNILQFSDPNIMDFDMPGPGKKPERILTCLPFYHIYGFNVILNYQAHLGSHVVTLPKFTPQDYVECLKKYKPTVIFVVPSLLLFLATHPDITEKHLSSLRVIFSGAAPMKQSLADKMREKMGHDKCNFRQGYGMTETSPGITSTPFAMPYSKISSCGQLLPSTEARIINMADGMDVDGPGKPGELIMRGPQVMMGYINNPTATNEMIDSNGWLHTGDVAYYDEDEYFYIVDRTKELIKVKGNQVSPTELESLILEIPGVADVAVIGIPDAIAGELPRAFVVKKQGSDIDSESIEKYITPKVASYKKLAGGIAFIDAIPRNPTGKIQRNKLKEMCS